MMTTGTPVAKSESLPLISEQDIVIARQAVRKAAQELGLSIVDKTKIVTAASELARNALIYGSGGILEWEIVAENGRQGLRVTVSDKGPGIKDLTLAMKDGWTSGTGLGLGLPGAKRLVNSFDITSEPGAGTTVIVTRWK
jgi:serine/threonine-protein kinase RsbT